MNARVLLRLLLLSGAIWLALTGGAFVPTVQAAGVWYVANGGSDSKNCATPATACASINAALGKPGFVAGNTVRVAVGTYTGSGDQVVLLNKDATLSGGWNAAFTAQTGMSTIVGEGVRNGFSLDGDATIYISRFVVQESATGIVNVRGKITLSESALSHNISGGGIYNGGSGVITITESLINDNRSVSGGGIYNGTSSTVILINSTVSGNSAQSRGGGITNAWDGTIILASSTVAGNEVTSVGSIAGGIAANVGSTVLLKNTIIAGNFNRVWNDGIDCEGTLTSQGHNVIGDASNCLLLSSLADMVNTENMLDSLRDNGGTTFTQALLPGSRAIDGGNPTGCTDNVGNSLTTDQRGFSRASQCDIGAYEFLPFDLSTQTVSQSGAAPGEPLTFTIVLPNGGFSNVTDAHVSDTLPAALEYSNNSLTATSGSYNFSNGVVTWNGTVPAGGNVRITFGAAIKPAVGIGFITNSAIISGGGETIARTASVDVKGNLCLSKNTGKPLLVPGAAGSWDAAAVFDPTVLKDGVTYKMWYAGTDSSGNRGIGYATSPDGETWTKFGSNPVLTASAAWEGTRVGSPNVIKDGGTFRMWYVGRDANGVSRIGYATSPDGITWTKYGGNPVLDVGAAGSWESKYLSSPSVVQVGSTYHMWYGGFDGITSRIGHATSSGGTTWTKDAANPVLNVGNPGQWDWIDAYAPNVVYTNGSFVLWYSGDALPPASQTGYATSYDGVHWTREAKVIPEGANGTFDARSADYAAVRVDGSGFDIWYSGLNAVGVYSIGYAAAQLSCASPLPPPSNALYLPSIAKANSPPVCSAYYADNFSNPSSGWPVVDDTNHTDAYVGGEYQMRVKVPSQGWSTTPGGTITDFIAAVTARNANANNGLYGMVFGINGDWSEYYEFDLNGAYFSIWKWNGAWTALQNWTSSSLIDTGGGANRLKVMRNGASISVYVSDHLLTTISDSSFTGARRFGLAVSSPNSGTIDVRFDDFTLYPVSCGADAHAPSRGAGFQLGKPDSKSMASPPPPK